MLRHKKGFIKLAFILVVVLFLLSNLSTTNVRAQENYSNYLFNQDLNVLDDKAMILTEEANAGNNYRNYFDSGFIFPAKLSTEMFSCYATSWTQYSFNQVYLDNLDDEYAFMSNNNSENIVYSQSLNFSESEVRNGTMSKYYNSNFNFTLVPNADWLTAWTTIPDPPSTHYTSVDNWSITSSYNYFNNPGYSPFVDGYYMSDNNDYIPYQINRIKLKILWQQFQYTSSAKCRYRIETDYGYDTGWLANINWFSLGMRTQSWNHYVSMNKSEINTLRVRFDAYQALNWHARIYAVEIECYQDAPLNLTIFQSDDTNAVNFDIEDDIDYMVDETIAPVILKFFYRICFNISISMNLYIFDYYLNIYDKIDTIDSVDTFILREFQFNKSAYYRLGKFKLRFGYNHTSQYYMFIQNPFSLNITYVEPNELGYHDIGISYNRRDDGLTYRGYYLFHVKLYKDYFEYEYLEFNTETNNFYISWVFMNLSNFLNETELETFEIDAHCRYGLNTLDIEITNIFIEIYVNSKFFMDFLEQDRKYFEGNHYQTFFNYTCHNRNYLNLTGVYGNYSYNCLKGIRCLSGDDNQIYNRFFVIPLFQDNIDVMARIVSPDEVAIPDEPDPPTGYYWTYKSYRIVQGNIIYTDVGNWTVEFTQIDAEQYDAKFFYNPQVIRKEQFGSWRIKIGDYRVWFNWLRDAIVLILNVVLVFLQFLLFLVVASLSFVFMFLGCYILVILYNICVYYILIALLWVLWWLWELVLWLYEVVIWIWANIIYPFLEWCYYVLLPLVIDALIIIIAFLLTCFVYVLTLGQIDFWEMYQMIYDVLWLIVDFVVEFAMIYANNIEYFFLFILWYFLNAALIYLRYLYSRARGNINRAKQLYYTFQIYIAPVVFIWDLLKKLLESSPEV